MELQEHWRQPGNSGLSVGEGITIGCLGSHQARFQWLARDLSPTVVHSWPRANSSELSCEMAVSKKGFPFVWPKRLSSSFREPSRRDPQHVAPALALRCLTVYSDFPL